MIMGDIALTGAVVAGEMRGLLVERLGAGVADDLLADLRARLEGEIKSLSDYRAAVEAAFDSLAVYAIGGGMEPIKLLQALTKPAEVSTYRQNNGYEPNLSGQKTDATSWEVGDALLASKILSPVESAILGVAKVAGEASKPDDVAALGIATWKFLQTYVTLQSAWRADFLQTWAYAVSCGVNSGCCRVCMQFKKETERRTCSPRDVLGCITVLLRRTLERIRKMQEPEPESEMFCAFVEFLAFVEKYVEAPADKQRAFAFGWWKSNQTLAAKIMGEAGPEGAE